MRFPQLSNIFILVILVAGINCTSGTRLNDGYELLPNSYVTDSVVFNTDKNLWLIDQWKGQYFMFYDMQYPQVFIYAKSGQLMYDLDLFGDGPDKIGYNLNSAAFIGENQFIFVTNKDIFFGQMANLRLVRRRIRLYCLCHH